MYTVTAKSKQLGAPQVASCLRKRYLPPICIKVGCRPLAALLACEPCLDSEMGREDGWGLPFEFPFPIQRGHPRRTLHPHSFPLDFAII